MGHRFLKNFAVHLKFALLVVRAADDAFPGAVTGEKKVLVRDITTIAGVRDNPLVGYSIVVGLNGTGDRQQTLFTTQTLANIMQRMGVQIPASSGPRQKYCSGIRYRFPSSICPAGHVARRDRFFHRRCQESRRRSAAPGSVARPGWPGLCGSAGATHAGRIFRRRQLATANSSTIRPWAAYPMAEPWNATPQLI